MKIASSYYKLVNRDTELIGAKWKILAIISLAIAAFTSITCSFSFYSLAQSFDPVDHRCILNATPKMKEIEKDGKNISIIDRSGSMWGEPRDCDFATYGTLFEGFTAIIWISLFMVCGNGGASNATLVPKPYRIVLPATLYFITMIIFSAYEVSFITEGIQMFCLRLRNESGMTNTSCANLFDIFTLINTDNQTTISTSSYIIMDTGYNYPLTLVAVWLAMVGFSLGFFVMIFRCLFVVDFQLVKVTIKTEEQPLHDEATPSTSYSSPNNGKLRNIRKRAIVVDEKDKWRRGNEPRSDTDTDDSIQPLIR